VLIYYTKLDAR